MRNYIRSSDKVRIGFGFIKKIVMIFVMVCTIQFLTSCKSDDNHAIEKQKSLTNVSSSDNQKSKNAEAVNFNTMPNVVGKYYVDASSILYPLFSEVRLKGSYVDGANAYDKVTSQSPIAGTVINSTRSEIAYLILDSQTSSKEFEDPNVRFGNISTTTSTTTTTTTLRDPNKDALWVFNKYMNYMSLQNWNAAYDLLHPNVRKLFTLKQFTYTSSQCHILRTYSIINQEIGADARFDYNGSAYMRKYGDTIDYRDLAILSKSNGVWRITQEYNNFVNGIKSGC